MSPSARNNASGLVSDKIVAYMEKHSTEASKARRELLKATLKQSGIDADMQSGLLIGWLLNFLVKISGAKRILEIGRFTGGSALAMAEALGKGGRTFTIDIDDGITRQIAEKYWQRGGQENKIRSLIGDALKIVPSLAGQFDLAFIDGDKRQYSNYWQAVIPKVRNGGIIVVDDALREGRILNPKREDDKAVAQFVKTARRDKRVKMFLLPLGDGVMLAIKK